MPDLNNTLIVPGSLSNVVISDLMRQTTTTDPFPHTLSNLTTPWVGQNESKQSCDSRTVDTKHNH
jgi:hypothetical protein